MSQICAIIPCNRTSRALCHCCEQNVCIVHLNEHNDRLNSHLQPLLKTIDTLHSRLHAINLRKTAADCREKLEHWRLNSHKRVDQLFEQKCQELDRLIADKVDEQQGAIYRLQSNAVTLIHQQQVTRQEIQQLTLSIDLLEREMKNLEEHFIEMKVQPLELDNRLISIRGNNEDDYELSSLSPAYKFISCPGGSYGALASNVQHLLFHQTPNLCLVDRTLVIVKRTAWRHGSIHDICWSVTLNRFVIINEKNLFLLNEETMSVDKVQAVEKRKWLSCTCSERFLFLTTNEWGSAITKISFTAEKKLDKQWQSADIYQKDEYIDIITYHRSKLAMIIRNSSTKTIRIELRREEDLERIWSLPLDIKWNPNKPFHCCTFVEEAWLVTDYEAGRLLHVTSSGRVKATVPYTSNPFCTMLFGSDTLAVSTKAGIHFHRLNYRKSYTIFVV